jgi:hypothetical protein
MPLLQWSASPDGRYWIDVLVSGYALRVMVDLGLVDPLDRVGFELDPSAYQRLKQSGSLTRFDRRARRDASGRLSWSESGLGSAQLLDPISKKADGPAVRLSVSCGSPGVPSRVGLVFFHRLTGCRVLWDLDYKIWAIECP